MAREISNANQNLFPTKLFLEPAKIMFREHLFVVLMVQSIGYRKYGAFYLLSELGEVYLISDLTSNSL